jgi:signal transduction histidine kinase
VAEGSGHHLDLGFGFELPDLFEGMGSPMIVTDRRRTVLWVNQGFCDLFGIDREPEQLVGVPGLDLLAVVASHFPDPAVFTAAVHELVEAAAAHRDEVEAVDGRRLRRTYWPIRNAQHIAAHVWRYDEITEEHRSSVALARATAILQELVWAHDAVIREGNASDLFRSLLDGLIRVSGSDYGFIGEISTDADGRPFLTSWATTNIAWSDETQAFYEEAMRTTGSMEFRNLDTLFGVTLRTGEVVIANDPVHDPRAGGLPPGHPPLVAYLGMPIVRDSGLIGMVGLAGRVGGFHDDDVVALQPLVVAAGALIEAFAIERERRAAEIALREALAAAEQANAAKSRLLGRVSHELRTPLNAVLGFAELLASSEIDPSRTEWIEHIRAAGDHVLAEVNDLIDLSAAEAGRLSLVLGRVELAPLVLQVTAMLAPIAKRHEVRVRSLVPRGSFVMADETRLRTVVVNLVSNAIVHNDPGGSVELTAVVTDGQVSLTVTDDGPGILPAQLEQAFSIFERLEAPRRGRAGAGLGLTIAREYSRAMGGDLSARQRRSGGMEFTVTLPAPRLPSEAR